MAYLLNSFALSCVGTVRGLFFIVSYICFLFFNPTLLYASQSPDSIGVVSGDSLVSYSNSINSELNLFIRFIFALAIVIILLIFTLWLLKYILRFRTSGIKNGAIDILAIRYIEQKKAIAIIRVLKRVLIIGIAENSISTLGELSSEEIGSLKLDKKTEPGTFGNILSRYMGRKSKS